MEKLLFYAQLCRLAYKDERYISERFEELKEIYNISSLQVLYNYPARALVVMKENTIIVILKGSKCLDDLKLDIQCGFCTFDQDIPALGKVHQGFHKYAMLLWEDIYKVIEKLMTLWNNEYQNNEIENDICPIYIGRKKVIYFDKQLDGFKRRNIVFVGHSLGSACCFYALKIALLNLKRNFIISCVTFGSPKLGDYTFSKAIAQYISDIHRIENKNDLITMLPISSYYSHIDCNMIISDSENIQLKKRCIVEILFCCCCFEHKKNIAKYGSDIQKYHGINTYIAILQKIIHEENISSIEYIKGYLTKVKHFHKISEDSVHKPYENIFDLYDSNTSHILRMNSNPSNDKTMLRNQMSRSI